jgi:hypothetical protein
MKVILDRFTIKIIPESDQDIAFIEDTMGLWKDGDEITLERIDTKGNKFEFRLETDLTGRPTGAKKHLQSAEATKDLPKNLPPIEGPTYERPVEDLIDCEDSWDGPPYKRTGNTKEIC